MQRLILMRHAEAVGSAPSGLDRDRALSPRGRSEARSVGRALAARGLQPDLALVSAATRTRQTWDLVREGLADIELRAEPALYNAPAETLRVHAERAGLVADCVILIAHNPGIHQLAMDLLTEAKARPAGASRMAGEFPTAAVAVFAIDADGRPSFEDGFDPSDLSE